MNSTLDSFTDGEHALANALNVPVPQHLQIHLLSLGETIPSRAKAPARPNWQLRLAFSGATFGVIGVFAILLLDPRNDARDDVYAAVIKALEGVDTVHITGWTTRVEQRWQSSQDEDLDDGSRYPIDTWEWFTDEGDFCSYSKQGPIVIVVKSDRRYEYDTRYDHLSIREHRALGAQGPRLRDIAEQFESMEQPGVVRRALGERNIAAGEGVEPRRAYGIGWEKSNGRRGECWIDINTDLPIAIDQYTTVDGREQHWKHGEFRFDVPVPDEVLSYTIPNTENVDYDLRIAPQFEAWHQHLELLALRFTGEPLSTGMALFPRTTGEKIEAYYPGKLPGITGETGLWVRPIQQSLQSFAEEGWTPKGSLMIPRELGELEINHDLLTKNDYSNNDRIRFVVEALGLSLTERQEDRSVWVARYDERPLKPWREVKAPVPNPDNKPGRPGMRSTWGSEMSMAFLLEVLAQGRDSIIIDETGLSSTPVATEVPHWRNTAESDAIAKRWFEEQFGVTFSEEVRDVTVYEVRRL